MKKLIIICAMVIAIASCANNTTSKTDDKQLDSLAFAIDSTMVDSTMISSPIDTIIVK